MVVQPLLLLLLLGRLGQAGAPAAAAASPDREGGAVVRLTDQDYAATLAQSPLVLVDFCARWSRPCKLLSLEYKAAARMLAARGHRGVLAQLDVSEEPQSARAARIERYPSVQLFRKGKLVDTFAGAHTADALATYVEQHLTGRARHPPPQPPQQRPKQVSAVLMLTESSFDQALSENDVILVEFYAPWCAHCKKLAPDYERAATTLRNDQADVALAKIDATAEHGPTARFAIQGYPTLLLFQHSEEIDNYLGERTASLIVDYMRKADNGRLLDKVPRGY